jgi:hypothetical protein
MEPSLASPLDATFETIDEWIRRGRFRPASARLRAIAPAVLSQKSSPATEPTRLQFARLCRRAGLPMLSLRALKPIVRPGARRRAAALSAPPSVVTEYAASLLRLGATTEASAWLSGVRAEDAPEKLLFEAFARFNQWDYERSIAPLEAYCSDARVAPYARLVGQINLAAALTVVRKDERTERLLLELIEATRAGGYDLLYGNAVETLVQLRIHQSRQSEAIELVREFEARGLLKPGAESILFAKWEAIARRSADPSDPGARERLLEVAAQARGFGNWEVVRDCDYHEARIASDEARMARLYFGTPFAAYRERIVALGFDSARAAYDWPLRTGRKPFVLDARTGEINGKACPELKPGSLGLKLVQGLASDFYRPWRVAEIHSMLYPGQHFDGESSPLRVHQLLHRTRAALQGAGCPIRLEEARESYRLSSPVAATVRVGAMNAVGDEGRALDLCRRLERELGRDEFSVPEAGSRLGIPGQTLRRWLTQARSLGLVERVGRTRGARYRLVAHRT